MLLKKEKSGEQNQESYEEWLVYTGPDWVNEFSQSDVWARPGGSVVSVSDS